MALLTAIDLELHLRPFSRHLAGKDRLVLDDIEMQVTQLLKNVIWVKYTSVSNSIPYFPSGFCILHCPGRNCIG